MRMLLLTNELVLLCSCLCKHLSNTARYSKWALNTGPYARGGGTQWVWMNPPFSLGTKKLMVFTLLANDAEKTISMWALLIEVVRFK